MNTIDHNVAIFRTDQFKKEFQCGNTKMCINNMSHVLYAVRKAYVDLTPRTLRKLKSNSSIPVKKRDGELQWLASELQDYLCRKDREAFQVWHLSVCRDFLRRFNENVLHDLYQPMHFGKAQKIVNMALKYIRCFDDIGDYEAIYEDCHMAIDSYIIAWYNRTIPTVLGVQKITVAWSNLSEQEYQEIQKNIVTYLGSSENTNLSNNPFEAEFDIWWEEKKRRLQEK